MACSADSQAPVTLEIEMDQSPAPLDTDTPSILNLALSGNLEEFRAELESSNQPVNFSAGRAVMWNRTPLHLAAMRGHEDIVEFILSGPGNLKEVVNARDCFGYTPLHLAVRHSRESVVRLLTTSSWVLPDRFLAATSEPDDRGCKFGGFTPLHFAALTGDPAIAKLLLRQPCQEAYPYDPVNFRALTWHGKTPLDIAEHGGYGTPIATDMISCRPPAKALQRRAKLLRLLKSSDLTWLQEERARYAASANAVLVGAALVAATTFGSWLQPPGAFESLASAEDVVASPAALEYWNYVFYVCNALAFSFALVTLVIATVVTFPRLDTSLDIAVEELRKAVGIAQIFLLYAVLFLLFSSSFAGSLVLHNLPSVYGTNIYYVVTWLPGLAYVYIICFKVSWRCKMQGVYRKSMQVYMVVYASLFWALTFVVLRMIKK